MSLSKYIYFFFKHIFLYNILGKDYADSKASGEHEGSKEKGKKGFSVMGPKRPEPPPPPPSGL